MPSSVRISIARNYRFTATNNKGAPRPMNPWTLFIAIALAALVFFTVYPVPAGEPRSKTDATLAGILLNNDAMPDRAAREIAEIFRNNRFGQTGSE